MNVGRPWDGRLPIDRATKEGRYSGHEVAAWTGE